MGADVPKDVPQSETVDETQRSRKDVDAEAQGPEHHGAYLEPVTCLRWFSRSRCIAQVGQEVSQPSAKPAPQ